MRSRDRIAPERQECFFFLEDAETAGDEVSFSRLESHHMVKVLRVTPGQVITASDGRGTLYGIEVSSTARRVTGRLLWKEKVEAERYGIHLGAGLGERLSWLVEKSTELGVRDLSILLTRKSRKAGAAESQGKLHDRLERVAVSALKQSKRAYLPTLSLAVPLSDFLDRPKATGSLCIFLDETALEPSLTELLKGKGPADFVLLVGPEAGFHEEERAMALQEGFLAASLGKARLRSETAAIAAVAAVKAIADMW
jgi:16S rRNA (uracil1498-N3)-methyltransferase